MIRFRNVVVIIVGVLSSFLFLVSLVGVIVLFLRYRSTGEEEKSEKSEEYFQFYRFNSHTNLSSRGAVSIPNIRLTEGYFTEEELDGSHILISHFDSEEYACTGSCQCLDEEIRRSTTVVKKSLFFLVAGTSSLFAYNKAKYQFEKDCEKKLSGSCSISAIESEVDECKPISESAESVVDGEWAKYRKYFCSGRCLKKNFKDPNAKSKAQNFGCESLQTSEEIGVDCRNGDYEKCHYLAKTQFQSDMLVPFCKLNSEVEYDYQYPSTGRFLSRKGFMCVGCKNGMVNHTIRCRQTYPDMLPRGKLASSYIEKKKLLEKS